MTAMTHTCTCRFLCMYALTESAGRACINQPSAYRTASVGSMLARARLPASSSAPAARPRVHTRVHCPNDQRTRARCGHPLDPMASRAAAQAGRGGARGPGGAVGRCAGGPSGARGAGRGADRACRRAAGQPGGRTGGPGSRARRSRGGRRMSARVELDTGGCWAGAARAARAVALRDTPAAQCTRTRPPPCSAPRTNAMAAGRCCRMSCALAGRAVTGPRPGGRRGAPSQAAGAARTAEGVSGSHTSSFVKVPCC